ncbi:transcriptional regulator [Limosilactobacillus reuteri]|uniref:transcriptional regulator n=1 Tax=Limosilactobacillus reuteri TaxID=1598 RepID=UPI001180DA5A|nr:transcriptional regulator [Limosilactobacillus reuteri]MCT3200954.1 transcriptional regulator [Limosilactobacillus reuteri]MCT3202686.1 transcriptional regulator [Limosilactobacillus reuteri]MCT3212610.1 transcriptional regulator [Limosilactobacillus reuteri]QWS03353.1 transcriptional regulator [Limosilactobacillus reuteri]TSB20937.1 transcriptional regulator [Limosilactobacillus reuteri]
MPIEQTLEQSAADVEKKIKLRLLERSMSQVELSNLIKENPQSVNRAIKGWTNPKSVTIRKKIYRVLNM